jgi:vitamin B12 transporter
MKFRLSANQTRLRSAYDDSFTGEDADFEFRTKQERVTLQWEWVGNRDRIEFNTGYTEYHSENRSDFPSEFIGNSWASDLIYKREFGERVHALAGFQLIRDQAELETSEFFTLADPYLNMVWNAPSGINVNAGARLNIHSAYGTEAVYNLNPSFTYGMKSGYIKAMASAATAYVTPSLVQLYGAFGANPELKPERNRSLEGGLEIRKESWTASLLYFNRREEQAVIFDNVAFVYFNSEDLLRISGVEAQAAWKPTEGMDLILNYTFTQRKGDNAIRIPKHKLNAEFKTRLPAKTDLSLRYQYTGSRTDTDFNTFEDVKLDPYSLLGMRLSRRFCKGKLNAFLAADNVLNERFTEVLGFQTPGRNVTFGWQLDL